jgi:type II secretory pathway pseudopilin PulG
MKRFRQTLLRNNVRGDTIVEVLIAVAIVSLVLVSAYAISSRSTRTVQDTQEHQQALSIADSQVEFLRRHAGLDVPTVADPTAGTFNCFNSGGDIAQALPGTTADDCSFTSAGNSDCTVNNSGFCYDVRIIQTNSTEDPAHAISPISVTYKIDVTWDSLTGGSKSNVELYYRVSQVDPQYTPAVVGGVPTTPFGPDGPPDISGCTKDVPASACDFTPTPGRPKYTFYQTFVNQTTKIAAADIASCVWNWGDPGDSSKGGGIASNKPGGSKDNACLNKEYTQHVYKTYPVALTNPCSLQGKYPFKASLVITKTDGTTSTVAFFTAHMPHCQ